MNINSTRTLARPRHIFDVPVFTVWVLAASGTAALAIAHALDDAVTHRNARAMAQAQRARARLGPPSASHSDYGVTDSWRVR